MLEAFWGDTLSIRVYKTQREILPFDTRFLTLFNSCMLLYVYAELRCLRGVDEYREGLRFENIWNILKGRHVHTMYTVLLFSECCQESFALNSQMAMSSVTYKLYSRRPTIPLPVFLWFVWMFMVAKLLTSGIWHRASRVRSGHGVVPVVKVHILS